MITASHNLFYDNGLKLFGPDGLKLSDKIQRKIADEMSSLTGGIKLPPGMKLPF